jgi:hypothetical protein
MREYTLSLNAGRHKRPWRLGTTVAELLSLKSIDLIFPIDSVYRYRPWS